MYVSVIHVAAPDHSKLVTLGEVSVQHSRETHVTALLWPLPRDAMRQRYSYNGIQLWTYNTLSKGVFSNDLK